MKKTPKAEKRKPIADAGAEEKPKKKKAVLKFMYATSYFTCVESRGRRRKVCGEKEGGIFRSSVTNTKLCEIGG